MTSAQTCLGIGLWQPFWSCRAFASLRSISMEFKLPHVVSTVPFRPSANRRRLSTSVNYLKRENKYTPSCFYFERTGWMSARSRCAEAGSGFWDGWKTIEHSTQGFITKVLHSTCTLPPCQFYLKMWSSAFTSLSSEIILTFFVARAIPV